MTKHMELRTMWSLLMNQKFKNATHNVKLRNGLAAKATRSMLRENGTVKIGLTLRIGVSLTVNPNQYA
jgi:hypothetical protein